MFFKKIFFILSTFFAFLFSSSLESAQIFTISTPKELVDYLSLHVTEHTLLVLDIDDTLLVADNTILRAHIFDSFLNEVANRLRLTQEEALGFIEFCLESSSNRLGKGQLVCQELASLLQTYLKQGVKVIALTKIEMGYKRIYIPNLSVDYIQKLTGEDKRIEDLRLAGLNFESSFCKEIGLDPLVLSKYAFTSSNDKFPLFKKGVLVTSLHPKGEVLMAFLKAISWKPSKVIFVDNILSNVTSVDKKMEELLIPCEGIHFNYVERDLCNINPKIFKVQLDSVITSQRWIDEKSISSAED